MTDNKKTRYRKVKGFYVYEHYLPGRGVFYVGKGTGDRGFVKGGRNVYWRRTLEKYGEDFEVRITYSNVTEEEAFILEKLRIDQLENQGIKLTNLMEGGKGGRVKVDRKDKIDKTNRKRRLECHLTDKNEYTFINIWTGEVFTGLRVDLQKKYGVNPQPLFYVSHPKEMCYGWMLKGSEFRPFRKPAYNKDTEIKVIVHEDGRIDSGTRKELKERHGSAIASIFVNPGVCCLGWTLDGFTKEKREKYKTDYNRIHWLFHKNGDVFEGTLLDFGRQYNVTKQVLSRLNQNFHKNPNATVNGWAFNPDSLRDI